MRLKSIAVLVSGALLSAASVAAELPQRWVSSGGSLTEWIVELGGQERLVGVDSTSVYPPALRELPSVGYQRALSAEGILALKPDLLIGSEEMGPPPVLGQLQAAGVKVQSLSSAAELDALQGNIEQLGLLLGASEQAQAAIKAYRESLDQQAERVASISANQESPRVLMLLGQGGGNLLAAGEQTLATWLIERAGGLSVIKHDGYKSLSGEAILALDPQVLLVADRALQGQEALDALLQHNPLLAQTSAGRDGRVLVIDPTLLVGGLGPRLPQQVEALVNAFYPTQADVTEAKQ